MRDPWVQQVIYLFGWAQQGQSPNGNLKDESSKYHQAMSLTWSMKGEAEGKMLDDIRNKKD